VYAPVQAPQDTLYQLRVEGHGTEDAAGLAQLEQAIRSELSQKQLLAHPGAEGGTIEVKVTHYYARSNAARFWVGVMAGRDKIISQVRVLNPAGELVGSFQVESTNATAMGSTEGLHRKHAEEIAATLQN